MKHRNEIRCTPIKKNTSVYLEPMFQMLENSRATAALPGELDQVIHNSMNLGCFQKELLFLSVKTNHIC